MTEYPDDMDTECIPLCDALNDLEGIRTIESCCGHGKDEHRIFFLADTIAALKPILSITEDSERHWGVDVLWPHDSSSPYFVLRGPVGPADMPWGANEFAEWLRDYNK